MIDLANGNFRLDRKEVSQYLSTYLVHAYLDSFCTAGVPVTLRFINPTVSPDTNLYVDVSFSCTASIRGVGVLADNGPNPDFFMARREFLPGIYSCIGKSIDSVKITADGALALYVEDCVVSLHVSEDDSDDDQPAWDVAFEGVAGSEIMKSATVSCIVDGSEISFILEHVYSHYLAGMFNTEAR